MNEPIGSETDENIRCVLVWPGWLRVSHGLIACGVLFEILSAWALQLDTPQRSFWLDWHLIVGQTLLLALLLRLGLLFLPGIGHWRRLLPGRSQWQSIGAMLKFYLSFARLPLPHWYAHNPLWKPVYLVLLLILLGCLVTGLNYQSTTEFLGSPSDAWHGRLASAVTIFTLLHILTVGLHDLKGRGAGISAMVNGYRYFHVPESGRAEAGPDNDGAIYVSVDSIVSNRGNRGSSRNPPKPDTDRQHS